MSEEERVHIMADADADAGDGGCDCDGGDDAGQIEAEAAMQQKLKQEKDEFERRLEQKLLSRSPPRPKHGTTAGGRVSPVPPPTQLHHHRRGDSNPERTLDQLMHPLGPSQVTANRSLPDESHGHQRCVTRIHRPMHTPGVCLWA